MNASLRDSGIWRGMRILPAWCDLLPGHQLVRRLPAGQVAQAFQPSGHRGVARGNVNPALLRRVVEIAAQGDVRDRGFRSHEIFARAEVLLDDAERVVDTTREELHDGGVRLRRAE